MKELLSISVTAQFQVQGVRSGFKDDEERKGSSKVKGKCFVLFCFLPFTSDSQGRKGHI